MDSSAFWDSSIQEILDFMASMKRRRERRRKEQVTDLFLLAGLIAERDPLTDKTGKQLTMPWDCYPELFTEERKQYEKAREEEEFEAYKGKRLRFVREFNARRRE